MPMPLKLASHFLPALAQGQQVPNLNTGLGDSFHALMTEWEWLSSVCHFAHTPS